jgi:hypothetical protein
MVMGDEGDVNAERLMVIEMMESERLGNVSGISWRNRLTTAAVGDCLFCLHSRLQASRNQQYKLETDEERTYAAPAQL